MTNVPNVDRAVEKLSDLIATAVKADDPILARDLLDVMRLLNPKKADVIDQAITMLNGGKW